MNPYFSASPLSSLLEPQELEPLKALSFEVGPIRPPSEAFSLLIRATRNCPWNRCEFCPTYKGEKFQLRPLTEIEQDIHTALATSQELQALARKLGYGDNAKRAAALVYADPQFPASVRCVALWLYKGGESAFLQDANSLILRTPDLVQVLSWLREAFPSLNRITSYGRSHTAARKSLVELQQIAAAGLTRLHIGLETGHDPLLAYVQKGATAQDHIQGGRRVVEAGISLSEYVMPGLGGRRFSAGHVSDTARVLNEIDPHFIRLRSAVVREDMPLSEKLASGDWEPLSEDEVVAEIGELILRLEGHSQVKSDHVLNLLPEVEGQLPQDKPRMLEVIHHYLSLSPQEKLHFRLGRRTGLYQTLADRADPDLRDRVEAIQARLGRDEANGEAAIATLKKGLI